MRFSPQSGMGGWEDLPGNGLNVAIWRGHSKSTVAVIGLVREEGRVAGKAGGLLGVGSERTPPIT